MIKLFNVPEYNIQTSKYSNVLHDNKVKHFEKEFCKYVGAKYAVAVSSATHGIFLSLEREKRKQKQSFVVKIPTMIPPVVYNAILQSGNTVDFYDDMFWVGSSYILKHFLDYKIIDSAQDVYENCFDKRCDDQDLMIFSFYPTKPISGIDGGIIVSNDKEKIDELRILAYNGMTQDENSWDKKYITNGYKMYMNSIQADVCLQNLKAYPNKLRRLKDISNRYKDNINNFGFMKVNSNHLFRLNSNEINIENLKKKFEENDIQYGKHYDCLHKKVFKYNYDKEALYFSELMENRIISIPFHEALTYNEVTKIIEVCNEV